MDVPSEPPTSPGFTARAREWATSSVARAERRLGTVRGRSTLVDVGIRVYERDKDAAGTLIGSAVSVRLFLFFVPFALFCVGLAGILHQQIGLASPAADFSLSGSMAGYIDDALDQSGSGSWIALGVGLIGIATTGRSLSRSLTLSSALSWKLGGKQKMALRAIGIVVGLIVALALTSAIVNRIRTSSGFAVASVSLLLVAVVYLVLWSLLFLSLPRGTSDPSAALPGAVIVALVMTGLQAVTQFFLPGQIASSASLYGGLGVLLAFLGWFIIIGRIIAFSFAVNAVVYERIGSVSGFAFSLPLIRLLPDRFPPLRRYFQLDHDPEREAASDHVGDEQRHTSAGQ